MFQNASENALSWTTATACKKNSWACLVGFLIGYNQNQNLLVDNNDNYLKSKVLIKSSSKAILLISTLEKNCNR